MASYPPNERPRFTDRMNLAALRTAVGCSRLLVKSVLLKWGVPSLYDDASVIVSELVTNAVRFTGVDSESPRWSELSNLNLITVRLDGLTDSIVISVWDTSAELPALKDADDDDESGRGLAIIDALASDWGSYPHRGGKVVWATIPVYRRKKNGLPQRVRKEGRPASEHVPAADADLLRRVRDGLRDL